MSYVLTIQEKLSKMSELAQENLAQAQRNQKRWYDRNARERSFQLGDHVLVLLPSSTNKLLAKWQGPYPVRKQITPVTYEIDMFDHQKRRVFHVNMLRKWNTPTAMSLWTEDEAGDDPTEEDIVLWKEATPETDPKMGAKLTAEQKSDLQRLLEKFSDVTCDNPGRTDVIEHDVNTGTARPVRLPPYRLPHAYRDTVKEIEEMLQSGIIEPSSSEWSAPIVLVKKKDGTLRFCVDYRRLNSIAEADAYPMPRVDEMIDRVGRAKFVTTLDLTLAGATYSNFGLYQFRVMPFGLQGGPATFQRLMDSVLRGLEGFSAAYMDDVIIYSETWEDHLRHIDQVLQRIRKAGLTLKMRKCQFAMSECVYLGHVVGGGLVQPEAAKLEAVRSFATPRTKKEVRAFLGLTGYYRKFIKDFASISAPLSDLTRKNGPNQVEWTPECSAAFNLLKQQMCSTPVLRSPDFEKMFLLQTDASDRGVGAVLSQVDENGDEHPVGFFSRKLLPREERYATVEKECLAIHLAVKAFRVYLLGRPFHVQTDHRSLEWMERFKENNGRLTRWSLALQPYDFKVEYKKGSENQNADALSRYLSVLVWFSCLLRVVVFVSRSQTILK